MLTPDWLRRSAVPLLGSAAALGALRAYSGAAVRRAEARFPPAGSFVCAEGLRLHFLAAGAGRPVVLVHGIVGFAQDFAAVLEGAGQELRAVAFDRPGHGYSQRPRGEVANAEVQARILHSALGELGIERPVLVGHSWGGAVALAYALRHPQSASGLVLLASVAYGHLERYAPLLALARLLQLPVAGSALTETLSMPLGPPAVGRVLRRSFWPDPVPPHYGERARALWSRPGAVRAAAEDGATLAGTLARLAPRYPEIRLPTSILTGDADRVVDPRAHSYPLSEAIPGARLIVLPRAGHGFPRAHADVVLQAIREI